MTRSDRPLGLGRLLSGALGAMGLASAASVGSSLLVAALVALIGLSLPTPSQLPWGWMGVVIAALAVLTALGPPARSRAVSAVRRRAQQLIYRRLLEVGPQLWDTRRTGDVAAIITDGVERVGAMVGRFFPLVVRGVVVPVTVALGAMTIDPWIGLTLLAALGVIAGALRGLERSFRSAGERLRRSRDTLAADFLDALQGLTTLKLFNRSSEWGAVLADRSEDVRSRTMSVLKVNQRALIWVDLAYSAASVLAVVGVMWWRLSSGAIGPSEAVTLFLLAVVAIAPLADLVSFFYLGALGMGALRRIGELADAPVRPRGGSAPDTPSQGELVFQGVTFTYPQSPAPALCNLDLTVTPGSRVALIGRSAAGKSTVAALALGIRHPQEGRVLVDGVDTREADPAWLSRRVTYVGQGTHLFTDTVAANLRVAKPDATREEMVEACRQANVLATVERLPQGFETVVGERGRDLSGGEAQRIGIARVFLADPALLILDEATSGLDLETETLVSEAMERLTAGRTVVVIAHRITTARRCDLIVQLQSGRIVARGAPDEIDEGLFSRMRSGP